MRLHAILNSRVLGLGSQTPGRSREDGTQSRKVAAWRQVREGFRTGQRAAPQAKATSFTEHLLSARPPPEAANWSDSGHTRGVSDQPVFLKGLS